jgi:hypothetical protein
MMQMRWKVCACYPYPLQEALKKPHQAYQELELVLWQQHHLLVSQRKTLRSGTEEVCSAAWFLPS